jgi:hypothetical protein
MPALKPTVFTGRITWLGLVPDRNASLRAEARDHVMATFAGVAGEDHAGLTRPSCSRVLSQYKRNTEIRNVRQFSIVAAEELAQIADRMGLARFDPAWIGASMVVEGLPDFSHLPPSSRLQGPSGATLVIDMQNRPCHLPAPVIDGDHPGLGGAFKTAANGRRGVTAWVECEGLLAVGDPLTLHIPDQRVWKHLAETRK